MTQTLPLALLQQAATRGATTALRFKRLGIWHPRSWQQLADEAGWRQRCNRAGLPARMSC